MKPLFMDYETFYTKDYSLTNMTTAEYILDPRFQAIGIAVKEGLKGETYWVERDDIPALLKELGTKWIAVSHNSLFDATISAWRYGWVPELYADTLGIARALLGFKLARLSLASIAKYLRLGEKGTTVVRMLGHTLESLKAAGLYDEAVEYACDDADLCAGAWRKLVVEGIPEGKFPASELVIMDSVIRCTTQPAFRANAGLLRRYLVGIENDKQGLLDRCGVSDKTELRSNDRFAELLMELGVDPPTKISPATGEETWAFAKTDQEFMDLQESDDPILSALIAARLGIKTSQAETRTKRFINIAMLDWPKVKIMLDGKRVTYEGDCALMPVPLRFSGAHTHRLSGDWKLNMQNLPHKGDLRRSLEAPDGYKVVVADASQIEARGVGWFSGCKTMTDMFSSGEDVYSTFASTVYGYEVNKVDHPVERKVGKVCILGLGYGMGLERLFAKMILDDIDVEDDIVIAAHKGYRKGEFPEVPALWRKLDDFIIPTLAEAKSKGLRFGPIDPQSPDIRRKDGILMVVKDRIILPNGLSLYYPDLQYGNDGWTFASAHGRKNLWGGKLTENIIQALARIITMEASTRIRLKHKMFFSLQSHDELAYIVRDDRVEAAAATLIKEMSIGPKWSQGWPLAAEAGWGQNYADAK